MIRIETEPAEMSVEIEGAEYPVAPKTIEICDKLREIEKRMEGEPQYQMWLAEIELLLGRDACRELFGSGKAENVDRIQMIYAGVAKAFRYNSEKQETDELERQVEAYSGALGQLNALLRLTGAAKRDGGKVIHRK